MKTSILRTSSKRAGETKSQLQWTRGQVTTASLLASPETAELGVGATVPELACSAWAELSCCPGLGPCADLGGECTLLVWVGKMDQPRWRNNACSACSIKTKNEEKWQMPAASVSQNSTRRSQMNIGELLSDIWHESHKSSTLDRFSNRMLAGSRAT